MQLSIPGRVLGGEQLDLWMRRLEGGYVPGIEDRERCQGGTATSCEDEATSSGGVDWLGTWT